MRIKLVALIALLILVFGGSYMWWRSSHKPPKAIVVMKKRPPVRPTAAVRKLAMPEPILPSVTKQFANPKVAIVMDDFGYNMNNIDEFLAIRQPITLSILPNLPYSRKVADIARANGYETILHLPLEPARDDVRQEEDTINSRMSAKEITAILERAIESLGPITGVSNHMGSKATAESEVMSIVIRDLKRRGLYFFDSLTAQKSVCGKVAKNAGVRCARRDVFLDLPTDTEHIKKQIFEMRRIAFKRGRAIAVCHDRTNTVKVLAEMMPVLSADGIEFVYLSEMVN